MNDSLNILKKTSFLIATFQGIKYYRIDRWETRKGLLLERLKSHLAAAEKVQAGESTTENVLPKVGTEGEEAAVILPK